MNIENFDKIIEIVSKFINDLGFPILVGVCGIALMIGIVYVIYLTGKWFAVNFLQPLFPRIFNAIDKHCMLVESAGKCLESIDSSLQQMTTNSISNDRKLDSIQISINNTNDKMMRMYEESMRHRDGCV